MVLARRHRLAVEFVLLALVGYLGALGVSLGLQAAVGDVPPPPPEDTPAANQPALRPLADYTVIAERDIFNPGDGSGAPAADASLRLWGVGLQGREAHAVIEDLATHRQDLYRVGDEVAGARIAAIDWDRVTLERAGREETLALAPPAPAAPEPPDGAKATPAAARDENIRRTGENAFVVDRREISGAADNMSGLLTQLRAVAEVRDGRPAGFKLFRIQDGSLFARLGLRDGDVVRRVNGADIGEPAALLSFLDRLRHEPRVALDIVRDDSPRTLVYDLR
jgi:general secretion pathway protein C